MPWVLCVQTTAFRVSTDCFSASTFTFIYVTHFLRIVRCLSSCQLSIACHIRAPCLSRSTDSNAIWQGREDFQLHQGAALISDFASYRITSSVTCCRWSGGYRGARWWRHSDGSDRIPGVRTQAGRDSDRSWDPPFHPPHLDLRRLSGNRFLHHRSGTRLLLARRRHLSHRNHCR